MALSVRPAVPNDIRELSEVLSQAFDDDPLFAWIFPDEQKRRLGLPRYFATGIRYHHLGRGGVEVAVDGQGVIGGGALWDPPGRWKESVLTSLIMFPGLLRALQDRVRVSAEVDNALAARHPETPHWYLSTIGTATHARGEGYGKALLNSRLERCDSERLPAYLESSKEANISYYQRFGFEVTGEVAIPKGGPTLHTMWREPQ